MVTPTADKCTAAPNDCSLRGAISAANAAAGADEITFAVNGPFAIELATTDEDANADGDFDITGR